MLNKSNCIEIAPISVIIPCFNSSQTLVQCIESVINQTLLPSEILLIDDCSSDNGATKKCIKELQLKYNEQVVIKTFFSNSNNGPGSSRNLGWNNAKNPYIAFLDSDDIWENNKIMCQWNYFKKNPQVDILGSNIKESKLCLQSNSESNFWQIKPAHLLYKNPYCNSSVVLKKNISYRFDEGSYFSEDFMLWAKIICDINLQAHYLPFKFTSEVINNSKSLSSNYLKMYVGELKVLKYISNKRFNYFIFCFSSFWGSMKLIRRLANRICSNI